MCRLQQQGGVCQGASWASLIFREEEPILPRGILVSKGESWNSHSNGIQYCWKSIVSII